MAATLRFGTPAPDQDEHVVVATRWNPDEPSPAVADDYFPFALAVSSSALTVPIGGTDIDPMTPAGLPKLIHDPESGLLPNGITDVALFDSGYVAYEAVSGQAATIHASGSGRVRIIAGLHRDLEGSRWMGKASVPADGYATLDALLTAPLAYYATNPSVMAYILADDVTATSDPVDTLAQQAMDRVQTLDVAHRPASASYLDGGPTIPPMEVGVFGSGSYPCRWVSTGVKRVEGDFSKNDVTFPDWQVLARAHVTDRFPGARIWWWAQAHKLGDGSVPTLHLAYPTAREIRKQVWELIGSGITGIIWFVYQDDSATDEWDGVANPTSRARFEAIAEMQHRISPGIRRRLLRCRPTEANDEFTASGGGSGGAWLYTNYADAYISTLFDATSDTYYVVVCNRSTSTANVAIDSAAHAGSLVNLETGASINVGNVVSLPPLDGAIFRFVPVPFGGDYGVPHYVPDGAWTTEEAWAEHWTNPASVNYVASGEIQHWPDQIVVGASDDLQAIVDAAPDGTTFLLAANGEYDGLRLTARQHLHFVADDPLNKPIIHGTLILGHAELTDPLGLYPRANGPAPNVGGYTNWVIKVVTAKDAACLATYLDPPRDILFENIRIEPIAGALTEHNYHTPNTWLVPEVAGMVSADWPGRNIPVGVAAMADVCFDGCEFRDWVYTNTSGTDVSGPMPFNHSGIFHNTGGVHNFVVRNCTLECGTYQDGQGAWHSIFYMDGGMGCAFVDNTISGAWKGLHALFLCNDDLAGMDDLDQDGLAGWDKVMETPSGRYNFVVGNDRFITTMRGFNTLVAENSMPLSATWSSSSSQAVLIEAQCWKGGSAPSTPVLEYHFLDNVVRDNTITGLTISSSAAFVRHATPSTSCGNQVGQTTISGNVVSGTVVAWYANGSAANTPSTATNNMAAGVPRDGV